MTESCRPPLKSERTRQAILEAAVDFIWEHSFCDLTVAELMANTGLSRPTFYQYFPDLYAVMECLLDILQREILKVTHPWLAGEVNDRDGLQESLTGMAKVCHQYGPVLRAVSDAAAGDPRMSESYELFMSEFDEEVTRRIEELQQSGHVKAFEARPVAVALNRMDAATVIHAFGRRPRADIQPVIDASVRIWCSTLYGETIPQPSGQTE